MPTAPKPPEGRVGGEPSLGDGAGAPACQSPGSSTPYPRSTRTPRRNRSADDRVRPSSPQTVTINVGQSVTWTNAGSVSHTTTSTNQVANDPCCWDMTVPPGQVFERVFTQPGTFTYYCRSHQAQGMTGTVVVLQQATATPTATATPRAGHPDGHPRPDRPSPQRPRSPRRGSRPFSFFRRPKDRRSAAPPFRCSSMSATSPCGRQEHPIGLVKGRSPLFLDNLPEVRTGERTYTFTGVPVGDHTLRVELRQNDGTPFTAANPGDRPVPDHSRGATSPDGDRGSDHDPDGNHWPTTHW
ncbi:MAG: hypothetical protein KatS3mg061_2418 [Dehalococcoidia bacterium]|nr:MAG: hypothetical protein KatS3mg061_2418 [Dehalococcoidia bacterium]